MNHLRGGSMPTIKQLRVNGATRQIDADSRRSLLSVLRDDLELTGCKYGCGEGQCGACTVLVDGQPKRSCTTPVADVQGKEIRTIEGLAEGDRLHPVQQAFLDADAMQCGYCTPGMIMAATKLVQNNPNLTEADIRHGLEGNICRCTGYDNIVKAVKAAAAVMAGGK